MRASRSCGAGLIFWRRSSSGVTPDREPGKAPMAAALTAKATPALTGPNFDEVQRSLPTPEAAASADAGAAMGALPNSRPGTNALDDLRQKIRPAPQERLARMVDLNEERTAQILRKWAAQEVAA